MLDTSSICGKILYNDGTSLEVGYEVIDRLKYGFDYRKLKDFTNLLNVLSNGKKYIIYHYHWKSNDEYTMTKISDLEKRSDNIHFGDIIYVYESNQKMFLDTEEMALKNVEVPMIEPKYAYQFPRVNYHIVLSFINDINDPILKPLIYTETGIFVLIETEMLNKKYTVRCETIIDKSMFKNMKGFKNYYKGVYEFHLITKDKDGNRILVDSLLINDKDNKYERFSCEMDNDDIIVSFSIIPELRIDYEGRGLWNNNDNLTIECKNKINNFSQLYDMRVEMSKDEVYTFTSEMYKHLFERTKYNLVFIKESVLPNNFSTKKVFLDCSYIINNDLKYHLRYEVILKGPIIPQIEKKSPVSKMYVIGFCAFLVVFSIAITFIVVYNSEQTTIENKKHLDEYEKVILSTLRHNTISEEEKAKHMKFFEEKKKKLYNSLRSLNLKSIRDTLGSQPSSMSETTEKSSNNKVITTNLKK
uniref:Dolichyl-diphosphooligosaccharide--protein glycosyltransferase subunit 1 n=1 Tax=Parastrongyloides trichosuri TaxID=131310 RepID=A0A0N4ZZM3_PARTI